MNKADLMIGKQLVAAAKAVGATNRDRLRLDTWLDANIEALFAALEDNKEYKFRGLPCNIQPDDKLWAVCGSHNGGGGVLEWCYDKADAENVMSEMQKDPSFTDLKVVKWSEE